MILKLIEEESTKSISSFIAIRVAIVLGCWILMILGTLIDFWSGTSTAKAIGESLSSKGFRRTMRKDADYMQVELFVLLFDALGICFVYFYILPFMTILCTLSILIIEGKSVIENNKRKKAHSADIPEIAKNIIRATTAEHAIKILDKLTAISDKK